MANTKYKKYENRVGMWFEGKDTRMNGEFGDTIICYFSGRIEKHIRSISSSSSQKIVKIPKNFLKSLCKYTNE